MTTKLEKLAAIHFEENEALDDQARRGLANMHRVEYQLTRDCDHPTPSIEYQPLRPTFSEYPSDHRMPPGDDRPTTPPPPQARPTDDNVARGTKALYRRVGRPGSLR